MAIICNWYIKTSAGLYGPTEVIEGLDAAEEQRLIDLGAASPTITPTLQPAEVVAPAAETERAENDEAIMAALDAMSKKELVHYGAALGIKLSDRSNKVDLVNVLKGEDLTLEALTDEALAVLAKYEGIDDTLPREELIAALEG
ncbi:hypothetical protein [Veillonella sp.]|uniref:hypothetical protein n=1 Tax=Veillonella sp. TaxID=1926307 RepID=UPI0025FEABA6|nr:hypothetical protein [Veillonella sp.]